MRENLTYKTDALRTMLLDYGAVKFGDFVLASGQKSDHYIDLKAVLMVGRVIDLIGSMFYDLTKPLAVDAIGGLETAAIPIAVSTVLAYHQDHKYESRPHGFFVRKEPKKHGTGPRSLIEGRCWKDDRVFVVEDVATTGGSILRAVEACRNAGAVVIGAGVVVDRMQGARELLADIPFAALLTKHDLGIS